MPTRTALAAALAVGAVLLALLGLLAWNAAERGTAAGSGPAARRPAISAGRSGPEAELRAPQAVQGIPGAVVPDLAREPIGPPRAESAAGPPRGPSDEPAPVAAEAPPETDVVRGRVRSRRGAWDDLERLLAGHLRLELLGTPAPAGGPGTPPPVARLAAGESPAGETWIEFAFPPVPRGAYVLSVSSTDALRIAPPRLDLTTPCAEIELWLLDDVATLNLGFRVLDAETLEPIADFDAWSVRTEVTPEAGVLFHAGPLALDDVPIDAQLAWRVWAAGYVPAGGDERAFAELIEGRWIAEVRLRRGWGRRFVALGKTPTMQPLRGARVELDGAFVGLTDAAGELDVELPEAPRRYSLRHGGLAAGGAVQSDAGADRRARISVIVLEPEP